MSIDIVDYEAAGEVVLQDPSDPKETVERVLMDKLAELVTRVEELADVGNNDMRLMDVMKFVEGRGGVLDILDDVVVQTWIDKMRQTVRCRYRRFSVSD